MTELPQPRKSAIVGLLAVALTVAACDTSPVPDADCGTHGVQSVQRNGDGNHIIVCHNGRVYALDR